ncbi:sigma-70 family RNA polymerase sigma factor [Candidatus Poribacteria bacterium]|nr:sigma-70 family RNA polymerase sigma factor [Candidatus Poribacteria bacterium]
MRDKLTDSQLVEKTLKSDMSAYGVLVDRYRSLVYGLAYHVVGNFHDAEDIAQEAFIKAYNSLSTLKDKAKFGNWLRVITLNLCKMWLRKSTRESLFEVSSLRNEEDDDETTSFREDDSSFASDVTPEDIYINKEFQESVFTALSALPSKNQAVITMFYLDDLSYKEIGDFLNLPVSTVQSRLQRARKQLKEEFLKVVCLVLVKASTNRSVDEYKANEMAKEIFQDNRLGPKFTQKVLDEIMAEGQKHLCAGEWSEAEDAFLKAIGIKPDHAEAHFYVGLVKEDQELYEEAVEWYQKAVELKPDYPQAYYNLAISLGCLDKRDDAQVAYDKAIVACKKLLELNPDDPELYKEMGEAYTDNGDIKNGIAALKHAIVLKPDYFEAYAYLGHAYQSQGDIEEAKRIYKQTTEIKVNPEQFYGKPGAYRINMAYNNLGGIYLNERNYKQAIFYMQKAVEKASELGVTSDIYKMNLAVAYANKGADLATKRKYAEAVTTYKEAIRRFDELNRPSYIKHRLTRRGHLEVIDAFEDFVSQNPEDAEAYYCLACLYSAKNDNNKASEAIDKAAKLEPNYRQKAKVSKFFNN